MTLNSPVMTNPTPATKLDLATIEAAVDELLSQYGSMPGLRTRVRAAIRSLAGAAESKTFDPHPEDQAVLDHYSAGAVLSSPRSVESDPVARQDYAPAGIDELENLRVQNHRLYAALEHIEATNEKIKDWSEECAQRRCIAEDKWRELALENARLRTPPAPQPVAGLTEALRNIHSVLDTACGDTDANSIDDDDLRERALIQWAAQHLCDVIDRLTPSPVSEEDLWPVIAVSYAQDDLEPTSEITLALYEKDARQVARALLSKYQFFGRK